MSDWAATLTKNFLERIEKDPVPDVRLDALEALGHTAHPGMPEVSNRLCMLSGVVCCWRLVSHEMSLLFMRSESVVHVFSKMHPLLQIPHSIFSSETVA